MSQTRIAVIVGSLRKDSFNRKLALAIAHLAPSDFTFEHLRIDDLPLYNQDDDGNQAPAVKRLKSEIAAAQGLLFVTPEYNRSMPGVLKNAHRQRLAALWPERVGRQAGGRDRHIGRRHRHRAGAAAPAQRAGLSGRADDGPARSLPAEQGRLLRRQGSHRRGRHPEVSADLGRQLRGLDQEPRTGLKFLKRRGRQRPDWPLRPQRRRCLRGRRRVRLPSERRPWPGLRRARNARR